MSFTPAVRCLLCNQRTCQHSVEYDYFGSKTNIPVCSEQTQRNHRRPETILGLKDLRCVRPTRQKCKGAWCFIFSCQIRDVQLCWVGWASAVRGKVNSPTGFEAHAHSYTGVSGGTVCGWVRLWSIDAWRHKIDGRTTRVRLLQDKRASTISFLESSGVRSWTNFLWFLKKPQLSALDGTSASIASESNSTNIQVQREVITPNHKAAKWSFRFSET